MELSKYIEHTNLGNTATLKDIEKLCNEAIKYKYESVCVYPYYVPLCASLLKSTYINICAVIGFKDGMNTKEAKVYEAIDAIEKGATEINMVINTAALKNKDYDYVKDEIEEIRDAIDGKALKVIIDSSALTDDEIVKMIEICNLAFVNFVEINVKYNEYEEIIRNLELINEHKNDILEIKISGEIKDFHTVEEMINLGVTRIGTSNGVKIMDNCDCEDCNHSSHKCNCKEEE